MKNDSYDRLHPERLHHYAQAYDSPEFKAWVASLTPEQYRHAEAEGLLSPRFDSIVGTVPLEEQTTANKGVFVQTKDRNQNRLFAPSPSENLADLAQLSYPVLPVGQDSGALFHSNNASVAEQNSPFSLRFRFLV